MDATTDELRKNLIEVTGRLVHDPVTRSLPSGDEVVTLRVSVRRDPATARSRPEGRKTGADWIDCALWSARLRRAAGPWRAGDWVSVSGELRRRYLVGAGGGTSLVEIEAVSARRVRRADQEQSKRAATDGPTAQRDP